ncbi:MAG: ABC transporter ATP-binding protein [Planctomycetes bacterium]|nr:ABC transporter ATP-binding protein [Planctomycetota bacterium]
MYGLQEINKEYNRRGDAVVAFRCDRLEIGAGEYVAVVGPSGSGKTTLLSLLGGMLSPTRGKVWLDGQSLYDLSVAERTRIRRQRMGFVFQSFNLIPYLTALENVQLPLVLTGLPATEQCRRATALLDRFGLHGRLGHKPNELSVGQQQRVALARTLVNDPRIILADEPTGNLDPTNRQLVLEILDESCRSGRTVVMVTHDPEAARHAHRQLRLCDGAVSEILVRNSTTKSGDAA